MAGKGKQKTSISRKSGSTNTTHQRINITLPDEIHTLAKVIAVAKGLTLADFFNNAIENAVKEEDELLRRSLTRLRGSP